MGRIMNPLQGIRISPKFSHRTRRVHRSDVCRSLFAAVYQLPSVFGDLILRRGPEHAPSSGG